MIGALHRALRILATALITAGLVIFVDVGLTLAWKEPVSSVYGSIQQSRARSQLDTLETEFRSKPAVRAAASLPSARRTSKLADLFAANVHGGEAIGRVIIGRLDLDAVLIEGTDTASLQKGPGHYPETPLPGQGGTVGIAGHRTTYLAPFRHIDSLEVGDPITLAMPYGRFRYTVQRHAIVSPADTQIVHRVGYERLVLTACHPLYSAAQRYAVFAKLSARR